MPKGPAFVKGNARRHEQRVVPWYEECARVDIEQLKVMLSVQQVRERGGLSYEERQALKSKRAEIQRAKEMRTRRIEARSGYG